MSIDQLSINTIRTLSMDAVQAANSGHPGTPMALAPVAYEVWQRFLRYDPTAPAWPDRDRFVLSCGHASMLLYSVLHLAGVRDLDHDDKPTGREAVSLDDIKKFRQLGSKTPGHPEYGHTTGVETTTGPLGQGVANSVGMAMAQRWLAAHFNRPGFDLFTHRVYVICSDGDIMEGISTEAASTAGHLKLSNLVWIYDDNHITIEGKTDLAFSEDVETKFKGLGWNTHHVADANDTAALGKALDAFLTSDRPTLIRVRSIIGFGAPKKANTHGAHGEPLGDDEIQATKKVYGWPEDAKFLVPDGVMADFAGGVGKRGKALREAWDGLFAKYQAAHPELAREWELMRKRELPAGWDEGVPVYPADPKGKATRETGGQVLNAIAKKLPWLIGGSADLAPSTKTLQTFDGAGHFGPSGPGRNLHFGIREHAMGAILNGLSLSKVRAYGAGFLIFYDYARAPLRLSALMEQPVIMVFTHDSIGVGEDGPTHQPVEQLVGLRSVPGLISIRPCDGNETAEAWKAAVRQTKHPVALVLTRQPVPTLDRAKYAPASGLARGAYVLNPDVADPQVILIGTGSEVSLCVAAAEKLSAEGVRARVVSMPSWTLFEVHCEANPGYLEEVLPAKVTARVSVEMASTLGWAMYVGSKGKSIGMKSYGGSAPIAELMKKFGFTVEAVVQAAKDVMK
ncbi:MAG: transketolase [Gemmataceae bacterium]